MTSAHDDPSAGDVCQPPCAAVDALLDAAGMSTDWKLTPLAGGANNRVWRLEAGDRQAVLKWYFQHPLDSRDRLAAEHAFVAFASRCGLDRTPRPLAVDFQAKLGLYEFLPGRTLSPGEVGAEQVQQAADFFLSLNAHRHLDEARRLPIASEACFSLEEHARCISARIARLAPAADGEPALARIVAQELPTVAHCMIDQLRRIAAERGLVWDGTLPQDQRRLSPSDFGFHNAILGEDGRLRFIDFEYAGWDDPAKTACDFQCQVKVPTPRSLAASFTQAIAASLPSAEEYLHRVAILLPLYRLKWCCIVLGRRLPAAKARSSFSQAPFGQSGEEPAEESMETVRRLMFAAADDLAAVGKE